MARHVNPSSHSYPTYQHRRTALVYLRLLVSGDDQRSSASAWAAENRSSSPQPAVDFARARNER